jgi:DNA-binding XRE family transcriptional regulator
MAQAAGFQLSHSTLVQYERGERKPRVDLALWLSKIFGEEVEVLFG